MARRNVERVGENKAAWENATSSAGVAEWAAAQEKGIGGGRTQVRAACTGALMGGLSVRCHKPVLVVREPDMIMAELWCI